MLARLGNIPKLVWALLREHVFETALEMEQRGGELKATLTFTTLSLSYGVMVNMSL